MHSSLLIFIVCYSSISNFDIHINVNFNVDREYLNLFIMDFHYIL